MAFASGRRLWSSAFASCTIFLPVVLDAVPVLRLKPARVHIPGKENQDSGEADELRFFGITSYGNKEPPVEDLIELSGITEVLPEKSTEVRDAISLTVGRGHSVWLHLEEIDTFQNDAADSKVELHKDFMDHVLDTFTKVGSLTPLQHMELQSRFQIGTVAYDVTFHVSLDSAAGVCPGGDEVGTCAVTGCDAYRNAVCKDGKCVCREGWTKSTYKGNGINHDVCILCEAWQCSGLGWTGGTCSIGGCEESRGAVCLAVPGQDGCMCPYGTYTEDGKCHQCNVTVSPSEVNGSRARHEMYALALLLALLAMAVQITM